MLTIDMDKIRELLKETHKKEENWRKVGRWVGCDFTTLNKIINHKTETCDWKVLNDIANFYRVPVLSLLKAVTLLLRLRSLIISVC